MSWQLISCCSDSRSPSPAQRVLPRDSRAAARMVPRRTWIGGSHNSSAWLREPRATRRSAALSHAGSWVAILVTCGIVSVGGARADDASPGAPVKGLHVSLTAASPVWTLGTTMTFNATVTNVGDRPVLVDVFGDLNELYTGKRRTDDVTSCWTLVWQELRGVPGPRKGRMTLRADQFVRLPPGASHTKPLTFTLAALAPGEYHVRVAYIPRPTSPSFRFPKGWAESHFPSQSIWTGMAYSNALTIRVVPASGASGNGAVAAPAILPGGMGRRA